MLSKLKTAIKSPVAKNLFTLISGSVIAQLIPLIFSPAIARVFSVGEQGLYAQVNSIMQFFSAIADGRLGQTVVLPKDDTKAKGALNFALLFTVCFSIFTAGIIFGFQDNIVAYYSNNKLYSFLWTIPVFVFLVGLQRILNYWLIRKSGYSGISISKSLQSVSAVLFMLLFGVISIEGGWLMGYLAGWVVFCMASLFYSFQKLLLPLQFSYTQLKSAANQFKLFPLFYGFPGLLVEGSKQASIFFVSYFFTVEETGFFNFTRSIILVPISMIGVTIGQIIFKQVSKKTQQNLSIKKTLQPFIIILASIPVIIIAVNLFAPQLFNFLFGSKWSLSGQIAQIVIWSYSIQLLVIPLNTIMPAISQHKLATVYPLIYFGSISSLFLFKHHNFIEFISLITKIEFCVYTIFVLILFYAVSKYEKGVK